MIERYGVARLLKEANAQKMDQSREGVLYRLELPRDESLVVIELTCPTTGRRYLLRVPPNMETAREAIAWTFDLAPEAYNPIEQT